MEKTESKFNIIDCLVKAIKLGASDIHFRTGLPPVVRINGQVERLDLPPLSERDLGIGIEYILPTSMRNQAYSMYDLDFPCEIEGISRFRVNLCRQLGKTSLVFRVVPYEIKTFEQLNLPQSLTKLADLNNGLILITGPTGSGKSTTIASIVEYINQNYKKHIITIEDPVEFIYTSKKSLVTQRQIGVDAENFPLSVKYAMRQDPDVIVIGEIRDRETMDAALKAAETGHLVLATLHTNDAITTINRVINLFELELQDYIRNQLAYCLRATIAQKILPKQDSTGRIPACEVLIVTPTIQDLIIKNDLDKIYELVKYGQFSDMLTLNMSLDALVKNGIISQETAIMNSNRKNELHNMLKGSYSGTR